MGRKKKETTAASKPKSPVSVGADETASPVDVVFHDRKGVRVRTMPQVPAKFATRYIEYGGMRYERLENEDATKAPTWHEVGKAVGLEATNAVPGAVASDEVVGQ